MSNLKAKLKKESGFTLIEMLIVVAIIAILIAISIPLVTKFLERAREATDEANERAALGLAMVEVLSENKLGEKAIGDKKIYAYYTIVNSKGSFDTGVEADAPAAAFSGTGGGYGKGTKYNVTSANENAGKTIYIVYDPATADFTVGWK